MLQYVQNVRIAALYSCNLTLVGIKFLNLVITLTL